MADHPNIVKLYGYGEWSRASISQWSSSKEYPCVIDLLTKLPYLTKKSIRNYFTYRLCLMSPSCAWHHSSGCKT